MSPVWFCLILFLWLISGLAALADTVTNQSPQTVSTTNAAPAAADTTTNQSPDLTSMSLNDLMNLQVPDVSTASKFEQKETEAPSSITVITSEDIKRYGWRTLAEILGSVQGFYISYDRNYAFLGTRGVNLGDFNSRVLLLVNGHRVNNDLNDGALIDTAFILDVDLIERVEIIRGPGSVLYGNNAFFGVINVITRQGKDVNGVEASGMYGTYNSASGRVSIGESYSNWPSFLISGSVYDSVGHDSLYYHQYDTPSQNNGWANNLDGDNSGSFFGTANYYDFTLEGAFNTRTKANPTAQYFTTFNTNGLTTTDTRGYATLKFDHKFEGDWDVSANVFYDRSDFQIGYPIAPVTYIEEETGEAGGGEVQVAKKLWDRHTITVGAEFRDVFKLENQEFLPGSPDFTDVHGRSQNYGIFAEGDFVVVTNLHVNAGVRYDQYDYYDPELSPRAGIIYSPFEQSTFKLLYGTAFRDPNFLEQSDPTFHGISPEKINSYEAIYEQGIGANLRSSLSGYYDHMHNLIDLQSGSFTNFNANTLGMEAAIEGKWKYDIRARLSYSLQHTENPDNGAGLPNSPMHLVKMDVSAPFYKDKIFGGLEFQYTSSSHTTYTDLTGQTLPGPDSAGYSVVNFTIFSQNIVKNLEVSASVYNLLGENYSEPASRFHMESAIPQDGRGFRIKATYRF